jgi:SAM-dependent methyltransferase
MSTFGDRLLARAIRATMMVDTAARRFDRVRSALVTRFASESVLSVYNELTYDATPVYEAGSPSFRQGLFNWEKEMIALAFPKAPGAVLVGGAGGGREAFALAALGYDVVAFDPSAGLARSMGRETHETGRLEALIGRYEDLPRLVRVRDGVQVDVRALAPFDAAMFGWTSYSHVRTPAARVAALRMFGELTNGPVVVSFFLARPAPPREPGLARRIARGLGFRSSDDAFTPYIGFYHHSTAAEIEDEVRQAGLELTHACYDDLDGRWPYLVLRASRTASAEVPDVQVPR